MNVVDQLLIFQPIGFEDGSGSVYQLMKGFLIWPTNFFYLGTLTNFECVFEHWEANTIICSEFK